MGATSPPRRGTQAPPPESALGEREAGYPAARAAADAQLAVDRAALEDEAKDADDAAWAAATARGFLCQ